MVVLGRLGSIFGAILSAALLILLPEAQRAISEVRHGAVGLIRFLCILSLPKSLFGEIAALDLVRRQFGAAWSMTCRLRSTRASLPS